MVRPSRVALLRLSAGKKEKDPLDTLPLDTLPEATQTGASSVGWRPDGQADQPMTSSCSGRTISATRFPDGTMAIAFPYDTRKHNRFIILPIRWVRASGRDALDQVAQSALPNPTPAYANYSTSTPELKGRYLTGPAAPSYLLITRFDSVARIVSGTFAFTAQKVQGGGPERPP